MEFSALCHKSNTYYVEANGQVKSFNIVFTVLWGKNVHIINCTYWGIELYIVL